MIKKILITAKALCLFFVLSSINASGQQYPIRQVTSFAFGPNLSGEELQTGYGSILSQLKRLGLSQELVVIDPSGPSKIVSFVRNKAGYLSWSQRQYLWRKEFQILKQFLQKQNQTEKDIEQQLDPDKIIAYVARNQDKLSETELIIVGRPTTKPQSVTAYSGLDDPFRGINIHFAYQDSGLDRNEICSKIICALKAKRVKVLTCEAHVSDSLERLWQGEHVTPFTCLDKEITSIDKTEKMQVNNTRQQQQEKVKVVLRWGSPAGAVTDLDLGIQKNDITVDFSNPKTDFSEWSRSTSAHSSRDLWEKAFIRNDLDFITIRVTHTDGPPPTFMRLEFYGDVEEQFLGKVSIEKFSEGPARYRDKAYSTYLNLSDLLSIAQQNSGKKS